VRRDFLTKYKRGSVGPFVKVWQIAKTLLRPSAYEFLRHAVTNKWGKVTNQHGFRHNFYNVPFVIKGDLSF
jgi:hypothetical protein